MGRLSGFSYQEVTKKIRKFGFEFYRQAKSTKLVETVHYKIHAAEGTQRSEIALTKYLIIEK